jgi:phosphate transport system substrate-binding protein
MLRRVAYLLAAAILLAGNAAASSLTGAGDRTIVPVLGAWATRYSQQSGDTITYQAIGADPAIQQLDLGAILFANTDVPLPPDELAERRLVQFPQMLVPIVLVANIQGISSGTLVVDGSTLADIYLGTIKFWDDRAIKQLNPSLALPHTPVSRSCGNGGPSLTFTFSNYLSKVSRAWRREIGFGPAVQWPASCVTQTSSSGVSSFVKATRGAVGYVEYSWLSTGLAGLLLKNDSGATVAPTQAAFQAAAANADFSQAKNFSMPLTDQPGAKTWPIVGATYMLLDKDTPAKENGAVLTFLDWCLRQGQAEVEAADDAPLPAKTVKQIEAYWSKQLGRAW